MPTLSRRDFLKMTTQGLMTVSGLIGLGGLVRYLSYEPDPPPPARFEIGPAENYPLNSRTLLADIPALLIHNLDGLIAIGLTCPHLGCTVEVRPDSFECPCHGSRYNQSGELLYGPARRSLAKLEVDSSDPQNVVILKPQA